MVERLKAEGQSRLAEQKRLDERKRNVMILIYRHLINSGYLDSATNLARECNIDLSKWDIADNIDLSVILQEYEAFFEMRFLKKPVLVRKNESAEEPMLRRKQTQGVSLPKIPGSAISKPPTTKSSSSTKNSNSLSVNSASSVKK